MPIDRTVVSGSMSLLILRLLSEKMDGQFYSRFLLGLVLSIYRYKNILPDKKAPVQKRYLKLTWETR